ncbi:sigma-70 family RNA polymerase sigma factor [Cupriavidus sp. WKF15]|uniref:RNA polymerase sigma factor n=1 Tax=Cupriavidus sp. WKF15 TaxID=3032282 RepID=UPI0023E28641|nr:sigma-70 family RNA polymerase sigma factor [Cupriavidus sp. WKF15]WER50123.1 sigma-70 family RNA polymerase sigma factor [Cupriavidus sp. WKF15]
MIPALRRYARALLREQDSADDLVQDCLEKVITYWDSRRGHGDTRSWVFAILHNLAMTALRRAGSRSLHIAIEDVAESLSARATQEDGLHYRDLMSALDTLPAEQRSVLLLVSVEDMSYADAARVLDIPIGTVMSRLSRARERLLKIMEGGAAATASGSGSGSGSAQGSPQKAALRRVK